MESLLDIIHGLFIFLQMISSKGPSVQSFDMIGVNHDSFIEINFSLFPGVTVEKTHANVVEQTGTHFGHFLALCLCGSIKLLGIQHSQTLAVLLNCLLILVSLVEFVALIFKL